MCREPARGDEFGDLVAAHAVGTKHFADVAAVLGGAALMFRLQLCREVSALLAGQLDQRSSENTLRPIVTSKA